ncbi:MAG TPA: serine hydrolase domain-containing protein [Solirubrobacteraceae bacterium]|nr:serine hydrolase domain-containing protein [Solirubrobacteraceae bacterium]
MALTPNQDPLMDATTQGAAAAAATDLAPLEPVTNGHVSPSFHPVADAFDRLVAQGAGGGALVVRRRGQTVVNLAGGSADPRGTRGWTPDTLAISFSTTKGVASTVVHRLIDRGLLTPDDRVADHWPAFAAGGKDRVTVRELLTHRAGLSNVQSVARRAEDLLDHLAMEERLAARTTRAPTERSAYHAITFGWLVSGLLRQITGRGLRDLVADEVAAPLGTDGLFLGAPEDARHRVAEPVGSALRQFGAAAQALAPLRRSRRMRVPPLEALHVDGFHRLFEGEVPPIWAAEMPAVNGVLSADGLARLYGALAQGGSDGGRTLLSPQAVDQLGRVQLRTADAVLGLPMRWRLGYHQAFGTGREAPMAFGHYGYGGSGGWADPELGLSVGFVTNRIGSLTTPLGDLTLFRLNRVVRECAARGATPR